MKPKRPLENVAQIDKASSARLSQSDVPSITLAGALRVPQAIYDNYAGGPVNAIQLAHALNMTPTSGPFRTLCGASIAYGLTSGGYNAGQITIEPIAKRIFRPVEEGDDLLARKEAFLKPRVISEFLSKYDNHALPSATIAQNVLSTLGVPENRAQSVLSLILEGAESLNLLVNIKDKKFVQLTANAMSGQKKSILEDNSAGSSMLNSDALDSSEGEEFTIPQVPNEPLTTQKKSKIFLAHGKNHKPLDDLKKILKDLDIQYVVAVDEPHAGRPISAKVAQLMDECTAGIFIFTKDELFFRKQAVGDMEEIWRPSENVVYELGAANILWQKKIIILREDGVNFPSDFSDLGYITFKDGDINSKAMEIFRELITFKLIRLQVG